MSEPLFSIPIVSDLRPDYYDAFHCLAAKCRLSCCKGWNITFSKKDYLSLRRQSGSAALNARLECGVRRIRHREHPHYGEFDMSSGVCPLLGEDGLCDLQKECGHDSLPDVCKVFPRAQKYLSSGYLERSLSPACEGVLELLWNRPDGIGFVSDPLQKQEVKQLDVDERGTLYPFFGAIRETCIDLLQERRYPLPQRIFLMGTVLQKMPEGEKEIAGWLAKTHAISEMSEVAEVVDSSFAERFLPLFLSNNIRILASIRTANPALAEVKEQILASLQLVNTLDGSTTVSLASYRTARERFQQNFGDRDYFWENLMVSLFFHLHLPNVNSGELLWKSYVNFCNLYSFYRFLSVMSCREGAAGSRDELFQMIVFASRALIHNGVQQLALRDELFQNDSATLAHMAVLLNG